MAEPQHASARSAALMIGVRLVNLVIGLATIPVLIRHLGGEGFAAWAILLAMAAGFSLLEVGAPTVVRFLALSAQEEDWEEGRKLFGRVSVVLALSFGAGLVATLAFAASWAAWLGLPDTALFRADEVIALVFTAVAARAYLQNGSLSLLATRRFAAVSVVSLLQPLCSNVAAMVVASRFGRLDLTLIAFWSAQLLVLGVTFLSMRRICFPRFESGTLDLRRLWELSYYGLANQTESWAQFINFQFDKFIVAGMVGLWGVAPYEVANRAVAALRSIPASGADTFLPTAMMHHSSMDDAWDWYLASTRLAGYGVCVFMLAPLAIAPVFLYAWTGEMGYLGQWVFVPLCIGAMATVMAMPASTLVQAEGRPGLQGRAAALAILVNVPLSLLLIERWGMAGAAVGTGAAMVLSAGYLLVAVHRHCARPIVRTLRVLARFWPLVLTCLCWGALTYSVFAGWFSTLEPADRFSRGTRVYPGIVAIGVYLACIGSFIVIERFRGAFSTAERGVLRSLLDFRRV